MEKTQSEDSQPQIQQNEAQGQTSKKKNENSSLHCLNSYNKRKILEHIQQHGYDEEIIKKFCKVKPGEVEEYIDKLNKKAQEDVAKNCNTPMFKNNENWIKYFESEGYDKNCEYEIPMMFKIFAETEEHPPVNGDDDIDFKSLYNYLSDMMRGYPPRSLNTASKAFLMESFNELIKAVESPNGLADVEKLSSSIKFEPSEDQDSVDIQFKSINPLRIE